MTKAIGQTQTTGRSYPGFINASIADGNVVVKIRDENTQTFSQVTFTPDQWREFVADQAKLELP